MNRFLGKSIVRYIEIEAAPELFAVLKRLTYGCQKIARLAHFEITDEEAAIYSPQMAKIVGYVEQLNELDTGDVEPMLGGLTAAGRRPKPSARTRPAASAPKQH